MKSFLRFIAICLSVVSFCSLIGCSNNPNNAGSNKEVIELTTTNWEEYLAYQETSSTSPVTQGSLLGYAYYKSNGTYTVRFYSKSDVKFENVNITIELHISTYTYSSDEKSSIPLSNRIPDDWYFANEPYPRKDSLGGTHWEIIKNGTLSNNGEISFSEPCKMAFMKTDWKNYGTPEEAIDVYIKEISGHIVIEK